MIIKFKERKKKKTYHDKLEKIIRKILTRYLDSDILESLKVAVNLKKLDDTTYGNLILGKSLPYRNFEIVLNNTLKPWFLKQSLRHELIHIKQAVNGDWMFIDVRFIEDNRYYEAGLWKGEIICDEYNKLPWEIEAYKLENVR